MDAKAMTASTSSVPSAGSDRVSSVGLPGPLSAIEQLPFPVVCGLVGLLWCVCSFLVYAPPLFIPLYPSARINDLMRLAEHPLRRDLTDSIVAYRLTVPVLAYLLHIRGLAVVSITYAANVAFIGTLFAALCTKTTRRVAFLGAGLIALSQAGQTGNTWLGYEDSLAHLCTAISLLTAGPLVAVCMVAGFFADERIVLALPFVLLWHWVGQGTATPPQWRKAGRAAIFMGIGLAIALALRHMLTVGTIGAGVTGTVAYDYIGANAAAIVGETFRKKPLVHLGALFFSFRWLWVLPLFLLLRSTAARPRWLVALTVVAILIGAIAVFWGGDHTRSIAFMFPAFVWLIPEIARIWSRHYKVFVLILIASVLTPQFDWDHGYKLGWVRPFPVVAIRMATGKDPADLIRALRGGPHRPVEAHIDTQH